eukprot:CAMPEP_0173377522 /NCGR_PEP_ID=MMETSP1356-20130122/770_1 /TAXON_ID=77927 ORGANISM="Hemiselmis virescens, Strain PCC157" /NCGR_SAMPLE_ID=MMETSP1356 /ASSEMBLY_ACC=CAM_ASM_000847 /LENGTH=115 /DNA_ID=CAMNT_0014330301 /DNA_START=17 /DNA_END=364 /DNA_ORIENTATION=+
MAWRAAMGTTIHEFRILLNPDAPQSAGMTAFINNQYNFIKALNPSMPFLIRESPDASYTPMMYARYAYGVEHEKDVSNMSEADVTKAVKTLLMEGTSLPSSPHMPVINGSPEDII